MVSRTLALAASLFIAALIVLPEVAAAQASEADVFVAHAVLAYEEKKYDEALARLREALELDPDNVEALYYTGLVFMAQQKFADAAAVLETARRIAPDELSIAFHLGVAYFSLERYDKAEPLLSLVFKERPQTDGLGYYLGFIRYRNKDYQGALLAFNAGATSDPNLQQLTRFYTGLALAILGEPELAAGELEEATRIRTVSPLSGPADRLRDTLLTARDRERRFHGELRFGGFYDSNVTVNPLPSGDPTAEALRSRKSNSPGELAAAHLEYAFLRAGPWEASVGYTFFQTLNNAIPSFNVRDHLGALSGFYRGLAAAMPFQIGLQVAYDDMTLGNDQFLNRVTATLFGTLVENSGNLTTLQGRVQGKDFANQFLIGGGSIPEENRSATNWMAGITHLFRFANDRHLIRIGYQYDQDDAKGQDWFYRGNRLLAGLQYTLPWGDTRLKFDFDIHFRKYPHPNAIFPQSAPGTIKQNVTEQNYVARVEKPLPYNFTVAADFQATISGSNIPVIFNYNRFVGTLSLAWQF